MSKFVGLCCAAVIAMGIGACGSGPDKSREDAGDTRNVDKTPPHVIAFNNHYPNVETKCDGFGHRLYVGSHDSSTGNNLLVIDDANCGGGR